MAQDLTKMQDIKYSEKSLWQQYYNFIKNQDVISAVNLLNSNPNLKYKVFNAFNWNRLINAVNDGTDTALPTTDSMLGQWNYDYNRLQTASEDFKYVGQWTVGEEYKANNLVKFDSYTSYFCKQNHIADETNKPPNSTYWSLALESLPSLGIQVSTSQPSNIMNGDIWFQVQTQYVHSISLELSNLASGINSEFKLYLSTNNQLSIEECLNQIELLGGENGLPATGTCVDGLGHSGPIVNLKYESSSNTLTISFNDDSTGPTIDTFSWKLDGQFPPTTQNINDIVTEYPL